MDQRPTASRLMMIVVVAIFAIASITSGLISQGFLEADGCTHYLYARFAFEYPVYLVDVWGRPFKTLWYAPAASLFGLHGVRVWSCVTALIVAWLSFRIAKQAGLKRPELAAIFLLGQPLFFMHSFSELTELPFAMLLGGSFLAYQSRRWWMCATLVGLMPLARPEGFGFVLIFFILLLTQKRWRAIWLLPIPFLAWSVAGWWLFGSVGNPLTWVFDHWPYSGDSVYRSGPIWHFGRVLFLKVLGPVIFLLMVVGVLIWTKDLIRRPALMTGGTPVPPKNVPTGATQSRVLILAIPLMVFVGHSLLYWLGKMASNGEPRYMLIVAPFWAVLAARGFEWVVGSGGTGVFGGTGVPPVNDDRPHSKFPPEISAQQSTGGAPLPPDARATGDEIFIYLFATILAIAPTVIWQISYPTIPLKMMPDWIDTKSLANWYKSTDAHLRFPKLLVSHPGVFYYLDLPTLAPNVVDWSEKNVESPPPGTILVWHDIYGTYNASSEKGVRFDRIQSTSWVEITDSIPLSKPGTLRVFVHE